MVSQVKYGTRYLTPNAHRALLQAKRRLRVLRECGAALLRDLRDAWRYQRTDP